MSDPRYNFWASMSAAFQAEMVDVIRDDGTAVTFTLLNDLHPSTAEMFSTIYDSDAMDRLYRKWHAKDFRVWNCYLQDKPDNVPAVRADIDGMAAAYPTDFGLLGAWHYDDGRPVGMQWDAGEPPELTGTPWYPQPPETINFMPDVITDNTDPENPVYGRPTELTDVLLVFGQANRAFTPE